jgi:4-carboxymuconolactone decarboxylase
MVVLRDIVPDGLQTVRRGGFSANSANSAVNVLTVSSRRTNLGCRISGSINRAAHPRRTGTPCLEVAMACGRIKTSVRLLAGTVVFGLAFGTVASAQDRMPPIPADKLTPAQKKTVDEYKKARGGEPGGPWAVLTRSPELMARTLMLSDYLRFNSTLPPRLSEFVILMTARQWGQNYEWNAHQPLAVKGGLKPEVATAIAEGRRPAAMAEDEAILYDVIQELLHNRTISDATYGRAVAKFGEQAVVDAVSISGYYTMVAMLLNTARTPLAPGIAPPLPVFP